MVAHIGIIGEYRHEALQSGFVMFGFIIKNTDIVIIPGQAFQGILGYAQHRCAHIDRWETVCLNAERFQALCGPASDRDRWYRSDRNSNARFDR
jgi:hypothetical protein